MKERWRAELAAVAVLVIDVLVAWRLLRKQQEDVPEARPEKPKPTSTAETPSPLEEARALRDKALENCAKSEWQPCLDGLDKAKALDPDGDRDPAVGEARKKAEDALRPAPTQDEKEAPPPTKGEKEAPPAPLNKKNAPTAIPKPTAPPFTKT